MRKHLILACLTTAIMTVTCFNSSYGASSRENDDITHVTPFPKVGPIMRYLTPTSVTFMGQGDLPHHGHHLPFHIGHSHKKENIGVALLTSVLDSAPLTPGHLEKFAMPVDDVHVGHVTLNNLLPGQKYNLKIGYASVKTHHESGKDSSSSKHGALSYDQLDWTHAHDISFVTPSIEFSKTFSIIGGSCRRIGLENFVTNHFMHWITDGDQTFSAMLQNIQEAKVRGENTDCIVWHGDQIYADATGGALVPAKSFDDYVKLYEKAFSQPHIRELFEKAMAPFLMMMDDHECWNDVDAEQMEKHYVQAAAALKAYALFQRIFGKNTSTHWFTSSNGLDIFHTNSRMERYPSRKQIISVEQMGALKEWVSDPSRSDRIKMIVTSVPFFLLPGSDDSWAGYNEQRLELIDYLIKNNIRHVMFMSGDAHCQNDGMFKAYTPDGTDTGYAFLEVLVSGIFAVARNKAGLLDHKADLKVDGSGYDLIAEPLSETLKENLFARISGNHETKEVRIQVYNAHNALLKDIGYQL